MTNKQKQTLDLPNLSLFQVRPSRGHFPLQGERPTAYNPATG